MTPAKAGDEVPAEAAREGAHREQVGALRGAPLARRGEHPAGDQAVQVHVLDERPPPGVQHQRRAELSAEAPGIGGERRERRLGAREELGVEHARAELHPGVERIGHGEHQVVVQHQVKLPSGSGARVAHTNRVIGSLVSFNFMLFGTVLFIFANS